MRKEEYKQQTRDLINYQENPPAGLNSTLNQQVQNLSSDLIEATILQQRLLETGQLSERAYKNIRQNMQDDTEAYYRVYKGYNDKFAEYAERQQPGSNANGTDPAASGLEGEAMKTLEEMHNFAQFSPTLDAGSGNISLLKFDKEGDVIEGAGATVKDYLIRGESKYNWFSMEAQEDVALQGIATVITADFLSQRKKGVATVESPELNDQYENWLKNSTIKIMGDETQMSKILYDYMKGMPVDKKGNYDPKGTIESFKVTWDPNVTGDNIILGYRDESGGAPLYKPTTDKTKELLTQYVSDRLEAKVGSKETLTSDQRISTGSTKAIKGSPQFDFVSQVATYMSTGTSGNDLAAYLTNRGRQKQIKNAEGATLRDVSFTNGEYTWNWNDGSTETEKLDLQDPAQTIRTIGSKYYDKGITEAYRVLPPELKKIEKGKKGAGKGGTTAKNYKQIAHREWQKEDIRLKKLAANSNKAIAMDAQDDLVDHQKNQKTWEDNYIKTQIDPYKSFNKQ